MSGPQTCAVALRCSWTLITAKQMQGCGWALPKRDLGWAGTSLQV